MLVLILNAGLEAVFDCIIMLDREDTETSFYYNPVHQKCSRKYNEWMKGAPSEQTKLQYQKGKDFRIQDSVLNT